MIKPLLAVPIIIEVFKSPGGLKEIAIKIAYGLLYFLSYRAIVWTTGDWEGGWEGRSVAGYPPSTEQ